MPSKLKEAREEAGYSIKEVAEKLNIRKQYIICLEEEDFQGIPGQVYVEGYTRMYYEFLGLEPPYKDSQQIKKKLKIKTDNQKQIKKQYIILFSIILLILIVIIYSKLKPLNEATPDYEIIQNIQKEHGNNEEEFDRSNS